MYYTYLHCKPDGTPFYVGKGSGNRSHDLVNNRNIHHSNIVAKYGSNNIQIFVFTRESENDAFLDEICQIEQLRRDGYDLCNITDGGEGISCMRHSDETKKKISSSMIGHKGSERQRLAAIEANKRRAGIPLSDEHKVKISEAGRGRVKTAEERLKISNSHIGIRCTEEERKKMSDSAKRRYALMK